MLQIKFNQTLFNKHVDNINKKLITKLKLLDKSKLSKNTICCLEEINNNIEVILSADINEIKKIIQYFESNYYCSIGYEENKNTELYLVLSKIFIDENTGLYKNFTNKKVEYDAYDFVKGLGLKTCPYCNRNYTFVVDEESGKLRPEIDHFYPKSIYPFLSMSFYNLIPSCPICNHTKKDKDSYKIGLVNPYEYESKDFQLTYIPTSIEFSNLEDKKYDFSNFEIEFTKKNKNIEVFKLEELYKQHKNIVVELLVKKAYYPKSYIEELKGFGFNDDEVYRYLVCNYNKEEDLHKQPLSKLTKDISEELGLI